MCANVCACLCVCVRVQAEEAEDEDDEEEDGDADDKEDGDEDDDNDKSGVEDEGDGDAEGDGEGDGDGEAEDTGGLAQLMEAMGDEDDVKKEVEEEGLEDVKKEEEEEVAVEALRGRDGSVKDSEREAEARPAKVQRKGGRFGAKGSAAAGGEGATATWRLRRWVVGRAGRRSRPPCQRAERGGSAGR